MSRHLFAALVLFFPATALAQEGKPDPYAKNLEIDTSTCRVVCLDDKDLTLFGSTFVIPGERPSVEQCGVWMSSTEAERTKELSARRKEADDQATKQQLRPGERDALRKKFAEPMKRCEADLKRRCEETRTKVPVEERKQSIARVQGEIEKILDETRKAALKKYLTNLLKVCALEG